MWRVIHPEEALLLGIVLSLVIMMVSVMFSLDCKVIFQGDCKMTAKRMT
jgi:hypothetical protein